MNRAAGFLTSAALAAIVGCSGGGSRCETDDVDCYLEHLVVSELDGTPIALRTVDADLLVPTVVAPRTGPPWIWACCGGAPDVAGWNGGGWQQFGVGSATTALDGVWAASETDAWVVGTSGFVAHWDGAAWTPVDVGTTVELTAVWGTGRSDVWAVGVGGIATHWDGVAWSPPQSIAPASFRAVWGRGPSDFYAVGDAGTIRRWDGSSWSPVAGGGSQRLTAVWGTATAVYVAGDNTTFLYSDGGPFGPTVLIPDHPSNTNEIWGVDLSDYYLTGSNLGGKVLLHNGSAITAPFAEFVSIGGTSRTDVWLVGDQFSHWNGAGWTTQPNPWGTYHVVHAGTPPADTGPPGPPTIVNQPPAMTFADAITDVEVTLDWTDPSGCRPAFCMQVCDPALRCSASARCTPLLRDGRLAGSTILALHYGAEPAADAPQPLVLDVTPIASDECVDPIDQLVAGGGGNDPDDALVGEHLAIEQAVLPPPSGGGGDGVRTWDGGYLCDVVTVTPIGTTTSIGVFACDGGACIDSDAVFTGTVTASGAYAGTTMLCQGCIPLAVTGMFSRTAPFVITGTNGAVSQTLTCTKQ